ncbi:MAG: diaminopimelate decarboxylase [Candidatus Omnitrophota bacterium]
MSKEDVFQYKKDQLYCDGVRIERIVKQVGTPCYIYSYRCFTANLKRIQKAFRAVDPLVCFALKANDNTAVIKSLVGQGAGCDIVSGGELKKALKVKADPAKIVFASVGKTDDEIRAALRAGILFFNVESLAELERIDQIAGKMRRKAPVALRVNPDVAAATHERITTGTLKKKFGLDLATAHKILRNQQGYPHITFRGIHMHIGSQITETAPYVTSLQKMIRFLDQLTREDIYLEYFDLGGGFGVPYEGKVSQIGTFARDLVPLLQETGMKIVMEPGRFILANAGIFVTRTLFEKDNGIKHFVIVDGGMNDFARPSLYDAYHEIVPVRRQKGMRRRKVDVVGPICESGDFFAKDRLLPPVGRGDLLAIKGAGAYGYVMASNYNVRGRPAEVLVKGREFSVIRKRETFRELTRGEVVPDFIKD